MLRKENYDWEALAQEFREIVEGTTDATKVVVKVDGESLDIYPDEKNILGAFYLTEELVDFCRVKGLSNYVHVVDGVAVARII